MHHREILALALDVGLLQPVYAVSAEYHRDVEAVMMFYKAVREDALNDFLENTVDNEDFSGFGGTESE